VDTSLARERLQALALRGVAQPRPAARCPRTPRSRSCGLLPGIGEFPAGDPYRGAGSVDAVTDDEIIRFAFTKACALKAPARQDTVRAIAERWRPDRMWTVVLLHAWARSEPRLPSRRNR
jgi:hypothetical protein